jgi:hypothetical protein
LYGTDVDEQVGEAWRLEQFDDVVDPSLGTQLREILAIISPACIIQDI